MKQKQIQAVKDCQAIMKKHGLGVVTPGSGYPADVIACDPIIWHMDDLAMFDITPCDWGDHLQKTMHEMSVKEGWEIIEALSWDVHATKHQPTSVTS